MALTAWLTDSITDINYKALPDVCLPSIFFLNEISSFDLQSIRRNWTFSNRFQDGGRFSQVYFVCIVGSSV